MKLYPKLTPQARSKILIDAFRGYNHNPAISAGEWYEMKNLTADQYPLLTVRPNRSAPTTLDGNTVSSGILAMTAKPRPVILYDNGKIGCGGHLLQLLPTAAQITMTDSSFSGSLSVSNSTLFLACYGTEGRYQFYYDRADERWSVVEWDEFDKRWVQSQYSPVTAADVGLTVNAQPDDQDWFILQVVEKADLTVRRQLIPMGAYVYVWPDRKWVNAERLASGSVMIAGTHYGDMGCRNQLAYHAGDLETITLTLCDRDGNALDGLTVDDEAPESGLWMDTSEETPTVKQYSESLSAWVALSATYVRITGEGLAQDLRAGDGVNVEFVPPRTIDPESHGSENLPLSDEMLSVVRLLQNNSFVLLAADSTTRSLVIPGCFIPDDGASLSFTLTKGVGNAYPYLRIERKVPEMDFVVECNNRLWGCHKNEIYASKLGDGRNWNVFQGLSTDSYAASRSDNSAFTGAAVLGDHPLFFREDSIEKVYPAASGAHQIVTHAIDGVQAGSDRSLAVIDDALYYKGRNGIYVYTGTLPQRISAALGEIAYHDAVAGALGKKYYVSMLDGTNTAHLLVYDTQRRIWCREDGTRFACTMRHDGLLYFVQSGAMGCIGSSSSTEGVYWDATSGILGLDLANRKYIARMQLRCKIELGASVHVAVQYDDEPSWHEKAHLLPLDGVGTRTVLIFPRRCDHLRIRLSGKGGFTLYSLAYEIEKAGS